MKQRLAVWQKALCLVHPVDKSLLLFMLILLVQSAVNLFLPASDSAITGDIDIVVRTSAAAIFGYFLSVREKPSEDGPREPRCLHQATITAIGLFCLVTLLALRNLSLWDPAEAGSDSATATVAQFRDFVSGCVGFLIGSPPGRDGTAR